MTYQAHYPPALEHGAAMPGAQRGVQYETVLNTVIFLMLSFSAMSILEPSPYDFIAVLAVPMWLIGGFRLHQSVMLILILWLLYTVVGFVALTPYWHEPDPRLFQIQSLFLLITVAFFTIYFSEKTERRMNVAMSGYIVAAMLSAGIGIVAYLNIGGIGALGGTMYEGRASGTFKDPNVLGSFLILAITLLSAKLLLNTTRRPVWTAIGLAIFFIGLFLTFSRGAWLATVIALMILVGFAYFRYADRKLRLRIITICAMMGLVSILGLAAILLDDETRELLLLRASVTQDYDVGETGRFGNQMRAIRTLLGQPEGFGPLRLRLTFQLDPHNSYIGAFANFGWIGGFLWLVICGTTFYVGCRLMWRRTPFQHLAIGVVPAMIALLLQGFQIDIDHWRHVYIAFGIVWGMEAARVRWECAQVYAAQMVASRAA